MERATHNRLVTGSNPVRAKFFVGADCIRPGAYNAPLRLILAAAISIAAASACFAADGDAQDKALRTPPSPGPEIRTGGINSGSSQDSQAQSRLEAGAPRQNSQSGGTVSVDTPPDPRVPGAGPVTGPPRRLLPADTLPLGVDQFANTPQTAVNLKGPSGKFVEVIGGLTFKKPCVGCTGVQIQIQNDSSAPIIVDGERAQVSSTAGKSVMAMSEDRIMTQAGGTFTRNQKLLLGATALTTLGMAEPILQDHFSTSKTDFPVSYGANETRRRLEDRRLSRRIILPGESTEGIIFFPNDDFAFDKVTVPIQTYPQGLPVGTIDISANPGANLSKSKKGNAAQIEKSAERKEAKNYGYGDPSDNPIKDFINTRPKDYPEGQKPKKERSPKTKKER